MLSRLALSLVLLATTAASAQDAGVTAQLRDGEGFAVSKGVKIWYRVEGAGEPGVPILIIHGGPGETARPFERTIGPLLALSRPVIYTDYRGAGRSERPADPASYSFEQLADDNDAIRKQLGISSWAVFGHSNGGATAITYAVRHPAPTRALVLCDPLLSPKDLELNMAHKVVNARPGAADKLRANFRSGRPLQERFESMFDLLERGWPHRMMFYDPANGPLFDATQAQLEAELGGKPRMAPQLWEGLVSHGFFAFDAFKYTGKLPMPVLVLVGRADRELSIDNSVLFAASLPAGRFVAIDHAGHFPYVEQTAATTVALESFLDSLQGQ